MADATLTAELRDAAGKGPAGRARRAGLVPGVVYGLGADNIPVSVPLREISHLLSGASGANTLITLKVDGSEQLAMARQIQRHPIKGTVLHVDFVRVRADQTITADIPVHLTGEAEGVKNGGILEQMMHSVSVESLPGNLPPSLEIDISELEIGSGVRVSDLQPPAGVVINNEPEEMVAQISAPRVAEEEVAPEGEVVEGEAAAAEGAPAAGAGGAGETPSGE